MVCEQADGNPVLMSQSLRAEYPNCFADVPVLPETLLLIDLEMQEVSVDLGRLAQLILGDLGATIQILQLANSMCGNNEGCSRRIEDCLSDLDLDVCIEALSKRVVCHDGRYKAIFELWAHSRVIAHWCRIIAEGNQDLHPNDAYMLGLFHAIDSLPALLGWVDSQEGWIGNMLVGGKLVEQWPLPYYVMEFFQAQIAGVQTKQSNMVMSAHQCARRSSIDCRRRNRMPGQLLHAF